MALEHLEDCPGASEIILKDVGKINLYQTTANTTTYLPK